MIASHYAQPVERRLASDAALRQAPGGESEVLVQLAEGDVFRMLDDSLGWAWGYGGAEGLVGYVRSSELAAR